MLYPSYSYIPNIDVQNDSTLAFIVDGELSETPPTTETYRTRLECDDPNATGTITWNGTSWVIAISNITSGNARCDAYFDYAAPRGWNTVQSGTLLAGIKSNNPAATTPLTIPGQEKSLSTEAVLARAEDDYGTSYYYRGAVENNYVIFANMCWRIVRIDGEGNTKITLYNYNPSNDANPCTKTGNDLSFAISAANVNGESRFNTTAANALNASELNTHIGFMYSNNPSSTDYNIGHANDNDSTILTNLKAWYDNVFTSANKNKLADVIWCNDKRVVSDTTYNPSQSSYNNYSNTGLGTGTQPTFYQSIRRLIPTNEASPSLKCGESKTDNLISKFTASTTTDGGYGNGALNGYKIGLLTADEVVFAGAIASISQIFQSSNESYYLVKNTGSYWTLSPAFYQGGATIWAFDSTSKQLSSYGMNADYDLNGVRPAVSLKSNATISGGDGTQANPFVVN